MLNYKKNCLSAVFRGKQHFGEIIVWPKITLHPHNDHAAQQWRLRYRDIKPLIMTLQTRLI